MAKDKYGILQPGWVEWCEERNYGIYLRNFFVGEIVRVRHTDSVCVMMYKIDRMFAMAVEPEHVKILPIDNIEWVE